MDYSYPFDIPSAYHFIGSWQHHGLWAIPCTMGRSPTGATLAPQRPTEDPVHERSAEARRAEKREEAPRERPGHAADGA